MFSEELLTYILRFVNSVKSSNVENKVIWSHIPSLRNKYLKNSISRCIDGFIFDEYISNNFEKISPLVGNQGSEDIKYNISKSEVNEAAKMFFALNSCPSFFEKLYWKAIYGPESRISMLASNILKKAEGGLKEIALKIFGKICSVLRFQYISYHHGENKSVDRNIKLTKNILDVMGERS